MFQSLRSGGSRMFEDCKSEAFGSLRRIMNAC